MVTRENDIIEKSTEEQRSQYLLDFADFHHKFEFLRKRQKRHIDGLSLWAAISIGMAIYFASTGTWWAVPISAITGVLALNTMRVLRQIRQELNQLNEDQAQADHDWREGVKKNNRPTE